MGIQVWKLAAAWYTTLVSLCSPGPCNLLEWNCRVLHWHSDLHGSALATRAWLHGPCTFVLRKFFKLVLGRDLHGSLPITRVQLHDSCTFISLLALWLSSCKRLHGSVALLTRPVYFVSAEILSLLTFSSFPFLLLYSGAWPKNLKWCRKNRIKGLMIEIIKTNEINYYAWDYLPKCYETVHNYA